VKECVAVNRNLATMRKDSMIREKLRSGHWIVNFETGQVLTTRSLGQKHLASPKPIGCLHKRYVVVGLIHEGKRYQVRLHRVIWIAAHGWIPTGMMPDHQNRIRADNRLSNLTLVTAKGNTENRDNPKGSRNGSSKLMESDIPTIRHRLEIGETNVAIAADYCVSPNTISFIRRGERWTHA
jgi:hypothetical protein